MSGNKRFQYLRVSGNLLIHSKLPLSLGGEPIIKNSRGLRFLFRMLRDYFLYVSVHK